MKRWHYFLIAGALLASVATVWFLSRNLAVLRFVERRTPGVLPAGCFARFLDSPDRDTVMSGFYFLAKRGDPVAVPRAVELLQDKDAYIWLNAALYLGACKRPEAVPYLIKALRHTAAGADPDTTRYLRAITGQDFGTDFDRWQQWWLADHPGFSFDWNSQLGDRPRVSETR